MTPWALHALVALMGTGLLLLMVIVYLVYQTCVK